MAYDGTPCVQQARQTPGSRNTGVGFRVGFQAVQPDTTNPELELFGGAAITREAGQAWAEPGVEAHDARDGDITDQIVVTGTVDMNSTGDLFTHLYRTGRRRQHRHRHPHGHSDGHPLGRFERHRGDGYDLVSAGTFTMGSPTTEAGRQADREDEHNVSLTRGFYLGKYEVTQAQYEAVMTGNTDSLSTTPSRVLG